ncbi:MAG: helix-turn-helix domain-containing protein [Candidatus Levybacteria bacterium]|nr:helix-turn-helix domain-containing protein [Candidatus Levybacteria bacterium]
MKHISDILKEERIKKGLSIEDVVNATKIRKSFIVAIEDGKLGNLPSESYALGFVKNYASYLGIPESRAAALFRREYDSAKMESVPKFRRAISQSKDKFSLKSPKTLLILGVVLIILGYIMYQFSFLVVGPKLEIQSPKEGSVVSENIVVVSGKTEPSANVLVNGEDVYVDLSGAFKKTLYLESNQEQIEIVAKNRYGKETKKQVEVLVR